MDKKPFFNTFINPVSLENTFQYIVSSIQEGKKVIQSSINVAILVEIQKNKALMEAINESDINSADGMGVIWGAKYLGLSIPERVTGIDLMEKIVAYAADHNLRIYFLGAEPEAVASAVSNLQVKYPGLQVAGYHSGFFTSAEEPVIVKNICDAQAHILFVAMGCPKQEFFIYHNKDHLNVHFMMPVGGSFNVIAGKFKRAPVWVQQAGFEWLYRLLQEPKRLFKRFVYTNSIFFLMILKCYVNQLLGRTT